MADVETAVAGPPLPPPPPATTPKSRAAASMADAVIYCFLGAVCVRNAASIVLFFARHAAGLVRVARGFFLRGLVAARLLCPFTILLLLLHLDRWEAESPEELVVEIGGVYATVQLHGPERPAPRRRRRGAGYGLIALLIFVFCSLNMLLGLLLQERSPGRGCCEDTMRNIVMLTSDVGSFFCSVMVISVFIPYVLVQLRDLPRSPYSCNSCSNIDDRSTW